jgi:hypothetical protein
MITRDWAQNFAPHDRSRLLGGLSRLPGNLPDVLHPAGLRRRSLRTVGEMLHTMILESYDP